MVSKRDWELRQAQWAAFHRWEASRELDAHPEAALADIGAVYELRPKGSRSNGRRYFSRRVWTGRAFRRGDH